LEEGFVTDISAGAKRKVESGEFKTVPAVSDQSMSEWMEYIYMQKPIPADVIGVEVVINVLDPNGNYYEVGRATSDPTGLYRLMFEPPVPGEYTVYATFAGSESYWPSGATTAIGVQEAPAATPEPTPVPASAADLYFLPMSIGTLIAIIVILLLLILLFRKK